MTHRTLIPTHRCCSPRNGALAFLCSCWCTSSSALPTKANSGDAISCSGHPTKCRKTLTQYQEQPALSKACPDISIVNF